MIDDCRDSLTLSPLAVETGLVLDHGQVVRLHQAPRDPRHGRRGANQLLAPLVESPDVAAERVLVAEGLEAVFAGDQVRLGLVHVPDVAGEGVPGQLLVTIWTRLLSSVTEIETSFNIFNHSFSSMGKPQKMRGRVKGD